MYLHDNPILISGACLGLRDTEDEPIPIHSQAWFEVIVGGAVVGTWDGGPLLFNH